MEAHVLLAVLFAAACHASWNAVIKFGLDPFSTTSLIAVAAGVLALFLLPVVGTPAAPAWPWLCASVVLHLGYYIGLSEAYRTGDMGQVYPLARGSAPLLTAGVSALCLSDDLGVAGWLGILVLAAGVILISLRGSRDLATMDRRSVGYALFTACTICGYSLVDGIGARAAGNAHAYSVSLFLWDGLAMGLLALARRRVSIMVDMLRHWRSAFVGGGLSFAAYWIAIWAMTVAPIAKVAALRETSVLFAAVIAVIWLGEPFRATRVAAAVLIVAGLALLRLQ